MLVGVGGDVGRRVRAWDAAACARGRLGGREGVARCEDARSSWLVRRGSSWLPTCRWIDVVFVFAALSGGEGGCVAAGAVVGAQAMMATSWALAFVDAVACAGADGLISRQAVRSRGRFRTTVEGANSGR